VQPLRSVFPDLPPIPPPIRNFMLTESFEILDPSTGNRPLIWSSDSTVDVHVQLKLLNNYPKYFQLTTCPDNRNIKDASSMSKLKLTDPKFNVDYNYTAQHPYLTVSHNAYYGSCFMTNDSWAGGVQLNQSMQQLISQAHDCSDFNTACPDLNSLPVLNRRKTADPKYWWNYSDKVKEYYPSGYIQDNMWDLTHYDYDDSPFGKAYGYHLGISDCTLWYLHFYRQ
jgi:hypothetical protein